MSKLIVEMEMPVRCGACKCRHVEFDIDRVAVFCEIKDNEYVEDPDSRPSWCPIKGVLPDEHGRLIDASTVIGIQKDEEDNDFPVTVDDYLGLQFPVPTIVPATERSEHGTTAD